MLDMIQAYSVWWTESSQSY